MDVGAEYLQSELKHVELLIVTTTETERDALLSRMKPLTDRKEIIEGSVKHITYRIGIFGNYRAAHVESTMGSLGRDGSTLTVSDAIREVSRRAVLMLGIAFGVNRKKQRIGDVIVAETVAPYELAKVSVAVTPRGQALPCGKTLSERFRSRRRDWKRNRTRSAVEVHQRLLVSGEKLIDDRVFRDKLVEQFPTAVGGEMEGAGAYASAEREGVEIILVKSICDWADGHKNDRAQSFSAQMAVDLAWHVLAKQDVLAQLGARGAESTESRTRIAVESYSDRGIPPGAASSAGADIGGSDRGARFDRAVEQLYEDGLPRQLGAARRLKQIVSESSAFYWPVMETISSYIRYKYAVKKGLAVYRIAGGTSRHRDQLVQELLDMMGRVPRPADSGSQILDLSQVDLLNSDLSHADLRRANLSKSRMAGTCLVEARLNQADLQGCKLEKANLEGATLTGANLHSAELPEAKMFRADATAANLSMAIMRLAFLQQARLRSAKLVGAFLWGADIDSADLREANLEGAGFENAKMSGVNLVGADLRGIQGWESIVDIKFTNIFGVRNPPESFVDWALENGALEMESTADWRKAVVDATGRQESELFPFDD